MEKKVIEINAEKTYAIVDGNHVQINQLNLFATSAYDYSSLSLTKQQIIDLAKKLQEEEEGE